MPKLIPVWFYALGLFISLVPAYGQAPSKTGAGNGSSQGPSQGTSHRSSLPGTRALLKDDDLLPTQNRTQAMQYEAETGKLPFNEDKVVPKAGAKNGINNGHLVISPKADPKVAPTGLRGRRVHRITGYRANYMSREIQAAARMR